MDVSGSFGGAAYPTRVVKIGCGDTPWSLQNALNCAAQLTLSKAQG